MCALVDLTGEQASQYARADSERVPEFAVTTAESFPVGALTRFVQSCAERFSRGVYGGSIITEVYRSDLGVLAGHLIEDFYGFDPGYRSGEPTEWPGDVYVTD